MIRGLYTSATSMMKAQKNMDVITNNLANVSTTGYKKDITVSQSFPEMLTKRINDDKQGSQGTNIGNMSLGCDVVQIVTDYSKGNLAQTNNSTDLCIQGSNTAFFTVQVPYEDGYMNMYTKNGSWSIDSEGYLVTSEGNKVLGQYGPVFVGNDKFTVLEDGSIFMDDEYIDTLMVVDFADVSQLKKYGNNLMQVSQNANIQQFTGKVVQGFIEESNVNSVKEMVNLIDVMRAYEANQKIIKAYDDTLDKVINNAGRV